MKKISDHPENDPPKPDTCTPENPRLDPPWIYLCIVGTEVDNSKSRESKPNVNTHYVNLIHNPVI